MKNMPHILVVDDNTEIRSAVSRYLEKNGMRATSARDASEMDEKLSKGQFDLIVLDVMMPGEDGLSVCRRLSANGSIPILMLTALDEETDRIVGLEIGADDYLSKPFNPRELITRIKAILRRVSRSEHVAGTLSGRQIAFAHWVLDTDNQLLTGENGQKIDLTASKAASVFDRTIDNQISRLRRKIEPDPARPHLITTVRGGGYCLVADVTELG